MENASKALLIAGGVLIGILVLTFFVYIYQQMNALVFWNWRWFNMAKDNNDAERKPIRIAVYVGRKWWLDTNDKWKIGRIINYKYRYKI